MDEQVKETVEGKSIDENVEYSNEQIKGYIINFYKYSATDEMNFEENDKMHHNDINQDEQFVRSVVWSEFDRIEVREVNQFDEYRLSKNSEKVWVGERQFLLLYEFNSEKRKLVYKNTDADQDLCIFSLHKSNLPELEHIDDSKLRFFGISIIDFIPEVYDYFYSSLNVKKGSNKDLNSKDAGQEIYKVFSTALDNLIQDNYAKN